ncbi:hypothetical protein C7I87_34075 [Mesorhizobium sp. SARCC-RB16n]|uniref:DUF4019 domain-containing protein n=1 Tax=Mesorhizobium sp. SARCC-RB16n TaxID=2116687 RepID=UPI00122F5C95|nr:DUF4019 domain-containing protein [Mesorhizobium sp. SARCC-RB16n]KAA3441729.1 hypothetical protein C7I87_34075 [Mesorhizobium sp. SARCC-RB16n]
MIRAAIAFIVLVISTLIGPQPTRSQDWSPPQDSVLNATRVIDTYFSLLDSGDPERAFQMMDDAAKASISVTAFAEQSDEFHSRSGPLLQRRLLKFTWLKDPADAPLPGIYVAVDIATKFEKIDRHCGYVALYQKPSGGAFHVMRAESNFIDNAAAMKMAKFELDKAWAELSRNCPASR